MPVSKISFEIELDDDQVPELITWQESRNPTGPKKTKAVCIAIYDPTDHNTMHIDLWTKDMAIDDMKGFYLSAMAGMADSIEQATGDTELGSAIIALCEKFGVCDTTE